MRNAPRKFKIVEAPELPDNVPVPTVVHTLPGITVQFLLGGRAFFTVTNPQNQQIKYKVHARKLHHGETSYFVRVMSVNARNYRYMGVLLPDGTLKATGRAEFVQGSPEFDVAQWAFRVIFQNVGLPPGYTIEHMNRCAKCGRIMEPEDFQLGFHKTCWILYNALPA